MKFYMNMGNRLLAPAIPTDKVHLLISNRI